MANETINQKAVNGQGLRKFRDLVVAALNLKADTSSLATVATSGSYNDLSSKPTIPTVGTLNTNNTTAQTASSSESLSGAVSLHKVSKTGSYNDLLNRPTIPTVNNATLTIQKNGTNVATFTANASTGATANITVPTATSDLTNDSGFLGDADVSYDANTKTLIIGGGSVTTYSITSTYSGSIYNNSYYRINDGPSIILDFPINVNEGDKFYCKFNCNRGKPTVTMNGSSITVQMSEPDSYYFTIPSVTGDVVISGGSGVIVG